MIDTTTLNPEGIYNSPNYYSGLKAGDFIFTAGRVPVDETGDVVSPNDAEAQTKKIMEDLESILEEGGATLQDVVHINTLYFSGDDMPIIHEVRQDYFGEHYPPHTGIQNKSRSWEESGIRLEIEVMAVIED